MIYAEFHIICYLLIYDMTVQIYDIKITPSFQWKESANFMYYFWNFFVIFNL